MLERQYRPVRHDTHEKKLLRRDRGQIPSLADPPTQKNVTIRAKGNRDAAKMTGFLPTTAYFLPGRFEPKSRTPPPSPVCLRKPFDSLCYNAWAIRGGYYRFGFGACSRWYLRRPACLLDCPFPYAKRQPKNADTDLLRAASLLIHVYTPSISFSTAKQGGLAIQHTEIHSVYMWCHKWDHVLKSLYRELDGLAAKSTLLGYFIVSATTDR